MIRAGQERIAYRQRSALASDLIPIMKKGQDAFAQWYSAYPVKQIDQMFINDATKSIESAISATLIAVIKKHTGIQLSSFTIDNDRHTVISNAWCATGLKGWKTESDYESYSTVVELGDTQHAAAHKQFMASRTGMYDLINVRAGTVNPKLSEYVRWDMGMSLAPFMYPSTGMGFLSSIYRNVNTDIRLADTVEEMASTILHELGHAFFMVADGLNFIKASDNLLDTYSEISSIANTNPGALTDKVTSIVGQTSTSPSASAAKMAASAVARLNVTSDNPIVVESINKIKSALVCATALATSMSVDGFEVVTSILMNQDEYRLIRVNIGAMSKKAGELSTTGRQKQRAEIIADSFATRHGLGAELALSLSKINSMFGSNSVALQTVEENNRAVNAINSSFVPLCVVSSMINASRAPIKRLSSKYPDELNRCKFTVMEHMNFFKTLPRTARNEAVITQWVIAGRKLDRLYENMKNDPDIKAMQEYLTKIGFENTRGTFGGGLLAGNTHNDYRKMQDAVDELIKSSAYFHAENFMTE